MNAELCRQRCRKRDWVLDLDIKGFFDSIDHDLLLKALQSHIKERWVISYLRRWLEAPVQLPNGELQVRTCGTPQGGVISPLLANLFLHYAFDIWMRRNHPHIQFERYAEVAFESMGVTHWWRNEGTTAAKALVVDIVPLGTP